MTEEMRKNMDEARAQLAQVEADRAAKEEFKKQGGRESFALGGDSAELYYAAQDQGKNAVKTGNVEDAKDAGSWAGQVVQYNDRLTNSGASIANEEIERRRARRELDSGYDSKRDELRTRYRNASTDDERNAIRAEGNEFLKGRKENQNIVAIIDDQYQKDYDAINARVQRGEISPFEAKALHDELRAKREAKIKRETGVDLAFQRAQKQQQEDEARLTEMKERMGQTTYTLFKAMDRTRDPSLSKEEQAAAMQVAGEAAMQMGQDFLENKFGPNSGYKSQVQVINDDNPATGMKEIAYRVTFTDANDRPVTDPKTGKPMEIKFDTARVKTALKDHFGFEEVDVDSYDDEGNEIAGGSKRFFRSAEGTDEMADGIEVGEGLYGGKRSLKSQEAFDARARAEKAEQRADTEWKQSQEDRATKEAEAEKESRTKRLQNAVFSAKTPKERDAALNALSKEDGALAENIRKSLRAEEEHASDRKWTEEQRKHAEAAWKADEQTKEEARTARDLSGRLQSYLFDAYDGEADEQYAKDLRSLETVDQAAARQIRSLKDGLDKIRRSKESWTRYKQLANKLKDQTDQNEIRKTLVEMATLFEGEVNIGQLRQILLSGGAGGTGGVPLPPSGGGDGSGGAQPPPHAVDW